MTTSSRSHDCDYVVVGGGCFGASTVLALKRKWPDARVIWFEGSATHTASKDINKIVRTVYPDEDYVAFAEQAMRMWKEEAPYCNYYHPTSWVQVISQNSHRSTMKTSKDREISTQELGKKVGSHEKPRLNTGETLWLNEDVGYVDSALALEAVAREAAKLGVKRRKEDVTRLIIDEGACIGVEADQWRVVAQKTIVSVGPWTPGLLMNSNVECPSDFLPSPALRWLRCLLMTRNSVNSSQCRFLLQMTVWPMLFPKNYQSSLQCRRNHTIRKASELENNYNRYLRDQQPR